MQKSKIPAWLDVDFAQERLNSADRLERYLAVVICALLRDSSTLVSQLTDQVLSAMAASELISDVRELATFVVQGEDGGENGPSGGCGCYKAQEGGDKRLRLVKVEKKKLEQRVHAG